MDYFDDNQDADSFGNSQSYKKEIQNCLTKFDSEYVSEKETSAASKVGSATKSPSKVKRDLLNSNRKPRHRFEDNYIQVLKQSDFKKELIDNNMGSGSQNAARHNTIR